MDAREHRRSPLEWPLAALIALGTAAFIAITAWQLIVPGPFDWHIHLPRTWQGGIEAIVLITLCATGFRRNSMPALLLLVALPALFYLRRHAVDLPFVVDAVYVEAIFAIGALARRCCGADRARRGDDLVVTGLVGDFVLGLCLWSIAAWTLSAFGLGTVIDLRWLTLVLAAIAFAARPRLFTVELWHRLRAGSATTRMIDGALLGWGLVLYARAGVAYGYDSLWYALRPESVLVADGSVFRPLGLVMPVYYFPKLYELLLTPLAALENHAVMIGLGLWLLLMIGLVCARLFEELGISPVMRRLGVALCVTLPAVCNIASVEAKPDTLALLLVLMALLEAMRYARDRDAKHLYGFAAYALLATQAKLTAIPYVGMLALALLTVVWQKRAERAPAGDRNALRIARVTLACAVVTAALVTARTWILTGMPTIGPDPLVALWRAFGMTLTPPTGTLRWTWPQVWSDVPLLIVDELFRPQVLPHIVITWLGNAWLLLAVAAGIASAARPQDREPSAARTLRLGAALMLTGLALLLGWHYGDRGSDGNYFAAAAMAAIVFGFAAVCARTASRRVLRAALVASAVAFASFQAAYAFTSGAWMPGTRAFDVDLTRGLRHHRKERWLMLQRAGIAEIADRMRQGRGVRRAVGYVTPSSVGFELPFRFEELSVIAYSHPEYFDDIRAFAEFLQIAHIDAIILPREGAPEQALKLSRRLAALVPAIEATAGVTRFDDRNYTLLDLSQSALYRAKTDAARPR